jgi:preprotein translocase subunit SecG
MRKSVSPQAKHRFLAKVRWVLTFLWAAVSIFLIFVAIYLAFKGNSQ